jgi:hypothetical protein
VQIFVVGLEPPVGLPLPNLVQEPAQLVLEDDLEPRVPRREHRFHGTSTTVEGLTVLGGWGFYLLDTAAIAIAASLRASGGLVFFPGPDTINLDRQRPAEDDPVASTATLFGLWSTMTVLMMSATIRTSRPNRMTRPRCFRK